MAKHIKAPHRKILHGKDGLVGEIGHIPIPNATTICRCGQIGCLESIIGSKNLAKSTMSPEEKASFIAAHLSIVVVPLIYSLNPQAVILWGDIDTDVLDQLSTRIAAKTLWPSLRDITVELSPLGSNAIAIGACSIALHHLFNQPGLMTRTL